MTANYMLITVAACEPGYVEEALGHLGTVVGELKEKANCVGARYGVVTLLGGGALTAERVRGLVPIFEQGGAMLIRFGTLITGSNAGKKVVAVAYPSMDAIQKTYEGLRTSVDYQSLLTETSVERREVVRFAG